MPSRALVTVGGHALPEPSTYEAGTATIVDASRNVNGRMVGGVIRDDVASVTMSWRWLSAQAWADINRIFNAHAGGKFINTVTFLDQARNAWVTKTMYVSDREASIFRRDPDTGAILGYVGSKLSLVEV